MMKQPSPTMERVKYPFSEASFRANKVKTKILLVYLHQLHVFILVEVEVYALNLKKSCILHFPMMKLYLEQHH